MYVCGFDICHEEKKLLDYRKGIISHPFDTKTCFLIKKYRIVFPKRALKRLQLLFEFQVLKDQKNPSHCKFSTMHLG